MKYEMFAFMFHIVHILLEIQSINQSIQRDKLFLTQLISTPDSDLVKS